MEYNEARRASPQLSVVETELLRSLVGKRIDEILCPTLEVSESNMKAIPPASIRLEDGSGFLVVDWGQVPVNTSKGTLWVDDRPTFRKCDRPAEVPSVMQKYLVVGACSRIDLGGHFCVTSIEVFQDKNERDITIQDEHHTMPGSGDTQITFYCGEARPLSMWAGTAAICFSRDMGLAMNSSLGLRRRMMLKS